MFAGRPTVDLDTNLLPPCGVRSFMLSDAQAKAVGSYLAVEVHAQIVAVLVSVSLSIVQVEVPDTLIACVDTQGKWTLRRFIGALHQGRNRQNRSRAHKDWQGREFRVYPDSERYQVCWTQRSVGVRSHRHGLRDRLPRPVVVPTYRWKLDAIVVEFVRIRGGCHEDIGAQEKLARCLRIDVERMMVASSASV